MDSCDSLIVILVVGSDGFVRGCLLLLIDFVGGSMLGGLMCLTFIRCEYVVGVLGVYL